MQNNLKNKEKRIKTNASKAVIFSSFLLVFIFLISFSSANLQVGLDGTSDGVGINFLPPVPTNITFINASDYWNTDIGLLDTPNSTQFENNGGTLNLIPNWLTSFGNNLWCRLTGCTMSGDLNMGNNDILDVNTINISNITYVNSFRSFDGNSIYVQPTGDVDDYFSFKTPAHRPTIKREGGKFIYFESSNVYDMGISLRKDDTYSGTLNYEKDNNVMTILGKNSPLGFKSNSEYRNYILFETYNHQPQISVYNGTKLKINDSLEVVGDVNFTGLIYGNGSQLTGITGGNSSWNQSLADTLYSTIDEPLWTANFTTYNSSWSSTYNSTYDGYNSTGLIINWSGDYLTMSELLGFNYWNNTYATFNKTYADTLYADISVTGDNSSWNETYADILYADISVTGDNSSWNESEANNLYVNVDGDTMSGDLNMSNNNVINVENYTGQKINVTCCVYLGTIQATDGDSIAVQPTGDVDDYFSFKTPAHRPTIKREGGKFTYFESSNVYDVGISFRADDTYSGTLNYEKDNHKMTLIGKNSPIAVKPNSEYNNYVEFETYNHQPQISVYNGTKLKINDSLEVVGDVNFTGLIYGNGSQLTGITGDNSSWNQSLADFLYRADSWDNRTGIPTATPSNGDTTNLSTANDIYDFVIALGYATTIYVDNLIANYYTSTQTDTQIGNANTSMKNYADGKFVTNSGGDSLSGQYDFNGGWTSNGLSIINGDIYAQTGYFYNLTGLDVSTLKINGSILPQTGFDNQFDIGSSSLRWRDLYLGGEIFSNGTGDNYFLGDVGIGTSSPLKKLHVEGELLLDVGRGDVYFENNVNDNSDGAGVTIRTSANPTSAGGSIFAVRSSGQAARLWVGQDFTSTGLSDFYVGSSSSTIANDTSLYSAKIAKSGDSYFNGGNVGIGTATPQNKLNVIGTVNATSFIGDGGSLTNISTGVPANAIMAFNQTTCPTGWILADGTSGTPDLRGIFVRGAGTSGVIDYANGTDMSATYGEYQNDMLQYHKHNTHGYVYTASAGMPSADQWFTGGYYAKGTWGVRAMDSHIVSGPTTGGALYGAPRVGAETRPASYALIYCMKTSEDTPISNTIWGTTATSVVLNNESKDVDLASDLIIDGDILGPAPATNAERVVYEYQFTEDNELDYSASFTNAMAAATITFSELPANTVAIHVKVRLVDTGVNPQLRYKRSSGAATTFYISAQFADVGLNALAIDQWIPTNGNSIYVTGVNGDNTSDFFIIGYKVGEQ